jgi:hypothetical protein
MYTDMNQLQELKENVRMQSTYSKAQVIAVSKSIHKSSKGNVWMVESSSVKGKFYKVEYISEEGELMCDCPHFVYRGETCKHCIAIAIIVTTSIQEVS